MIKISSIKRNPDNPRTIKDDRFEKLKASLKAFPEMLEKRPIVLHSKANKTVLGGNMRIEALKANGHKEIPEKWVAYADEWTEEQRQEFIIKDNVPFGQWDWDVLANEWDEGQLAEWGLEIPAFVGEEGYGTDFELPDGDREPFQQMTFTLADEQAEAIKAQLAAVKQSEEFKYAETFGNENGNGNALYLAVMNGKG